MLFQFGGNAFRAQSDSRQSHGKNRHHFWSGRLVIDLNRLKSVVSTPSDSAVFPTGFAYRYNRANQRIRATAWDRSYWSYRYDALGQVTSGRKNWPEDLPVPGQQYEYGYDDIGNRTAVAFGGDENGVNLRSATYTANALNQYTSRSNPGTGDAHFAACDGNGNVNALVNATTGTYSAQYEYDPFGQTIRATGPMAESNPYHFSTKYQDEESGLYYYGYRYYNPSTGRWLSRDPIGENGGINPFAFIESHPIQGFDAYGLTEEPNPGFVSQWPTFLVNIGLKIPGAGFCGRAAICIEAHRRCREGCESEYGFAAIDENPAALKKCLADCNAHLLACGGKSRRKRYDDDITKSKTPKKKFPKTP
jgi:RHS repeat-associated protein